MTETVTIHLSPLHQEVVTSLQRRWKTLLISGIILIVLGLIAITLPWVFTLGIELFIGVLLLVAGLVQLIHLFQSRGLKGFLSTLLLALVSVIVGILLLTYPLAGMLTLTLLLSLFFLAAGIAKLILGIQLRPIAGWGWIVSSGIISLLIALLIWAGWPGTGLWVLGLLLGIDFLFAGIYMVALAMAHRQLS